MFDALAGGTSGGATPPSRELISTAAYGISRPRG